MTDRRGLEESGSPDLLGCVLAGGRSARFGAPKARARVGGSSLAARGRDTLAKVVTRVVLISGDPELAGELGLEDRPDRVPGQGPLGGLTTALHWALDEGCPGVLVLACDLPLVPPQLLERLLGDWDGRKAVVPQSRGPLGLEPLCAAYPLACLAALEASLGAGVRSMGAAIGLIEPTVLPMESFADLGEPEDLFLNVNRPEDLERARGMVVREERSGHA